MTNFNITSKTSLNTIADRIIVLNSVIATSSIEIGALLAEAQTRFGSPDLFMDWADKTLGYKKTYVYRFLQVHKQFGGKEWATEMSMGALVALLGASEAVKQVAEASVKAGQPLTAKDVKEVKAEEAGDELPQASKDKKADDAPKELSAKELTKALDKANKQAEIEAQRHSVQIEKAKQAKDDAIKASRKALTELEQAKQMIEAQKAEIARLNDEVAALKAELESKSVVSQIAELMEIAEEVTEQGADDLPWSDEEPANELDAATQLEAFEIAYCDLLATQPRKIVINTDLAAESAGIEKDGKKYKFDGNLLTGAELRALIA